MEGCCPLPVSVGERRMVVLAEGCFSPLGAKTAACLVRYIPEEIAAVIDSSQAPSLASEVLGYGGDIPVVGSLEDSLAFDPDMLVLGTAPKGGRFPPGTREFVVEAVGKGLHIISGMHEFLADDQELVRMAGERGVVLWDVRRTPGDLEVSSGERCPRCTVILTVGSDCNTGKMTAAIEIQRGLQAAGVKAAFAASGQTGIMITGKGIPIDRVVADFISGATERLVLQEAPGMDVVVLEGQGSIIHPGYAGVTVGMISGALPRGLVMCHQPTRRIVRNYTIPIPPLTRLIGIYEHAIDWIGSAEVIGIALNTFDMAEEEARAAVEAAKRETGLPAADPVRFGPDELVEAVIGLLST